MKTFRKLSYLVAIIAIGLGFTWGISRHVSATSAPQTLPFNQDWSTTSMITVDNDWSGVPGIIGYRGDGITNTFDDLRTILADGSGTPVDVLANRSDPSVITEGGVTEFDGLANPTIAIMGTFFEDVPHIVIYLDTSGKSNVQLSFNARDIEPGDGAIQVNTQVRIGGTGNYANLDGGYIADATVAGSGLVTPVVVTLPPSANNQPLVEVRIMTINAAGADEFIGIDDIDISGTDTQQPPFEQSWSNASLISVDDDWSEVPGIVGYRGDDLNTTPDTDLRTILDDGSDTPVDVNANESNPDTFEEGGVTEFDGIADPTIALAGSDEADVPHLVLSLNTTGLSNVQVTYNTKSLSNSPQAQTMSQVNTQARAAGLCGLCLGETGQFTNLDGGYIADASGPGLVIPVEVTLPAWANDQPLVEVRIMTINSAGDDVYIGIDDIEVTATIIPTVAVSVPTDLTGLNGSTLTVPVNVGDVTGLGIISYDFTVTFDPAVMTPNVVNFDSNGTLSDGYTVTTNSATPGTLVVSGFGTSDLAGSGTLLNLKFDLVGDAPSCTPVDFSSFEFNEGNPDAQPTAGQVCVINGAISGRITYGNAATETPVQDVLITATGEPVVTDTSDSDGLYELFGLGGGAYIVTPEKTGDVNGISAFDAALVAQRVVGIITFTPNQALAGDVSGNGTITSFDAAQIAQFVIEIPNTSLTGTWTFSPASRNYPTTTSPDTDEDYTAILMGEVSGNWTPASLARSKEGGKSSGLSSTAPIDVRLPAAYGLPNTTISIPVMVGDELGGSGVLAYEIDLHYDPSILQPEVSFASTSATLSAGMSVSVNNSTAGRSRIAVFGTAPMSGEGTLINLRFKVIGAPGQISPLTWTRFAFNEGDPASVTNNGQVTVASAPSSAVGIVGRVVTALGNGLPRVQVTLAGANGSTRAITNGLGYFRFFDVVPGQVYVVTVRSKDQQFGDPTQVVFVGDNVTDLLFVASP